MMDKTLARLGELSQPGALLDPDLLARVLETLPDGIVIIDEGGVIRYVNGQTELMFGYARETLLEYDE
mgnify:CR=1 FL=1